MYVQPAYYRSLEPKTRKLIDKCRKDDAFVDDYAYLINAVDEELRWHETNDGIFVISNPTWRRLRRKYKALNRVLRYHIKHWCLKF